MLAYRRCPLCPHRRFLRSSRSLGDTSPAYSLWTDDNIQTKGGSTALWFHFPNITKYKGAPRQAILIQ